MNRRDVASSDGGGGDGRRPAKQAKIVNAKKERQRMERKKKREEQKQLRNMPRKCSECYLWKPKIEYSHRQWTKDLPHPNAHITKEEILDLQQKCLACYPSWVEIADVTRQKLEKQRKAWVDKWKDEEGDKDVAFYAWPLRNFLYEENQVLQSISSKSLTGQKYRILFSRGVSTECECRTLKDCFLNVIKNTHEDGDECVEIKVVQSNDRLKQGYFLYSNFTLKEEKGGDHPFLATDHPMLATDEPLPDDPDDPENFIPFAYLYEVESRIALPWRENEMDSDDEEEDSDDEEEEEVHIEFDNLEEAARLMQFYENGNGSGDWLCRHKGLTPEIAKRIHDFVVWKPCPVFYFEPGDVLLHVVHFTHDQSTDPCTIQCYIARKVE